MSEEINQFIQNYDGPTEEEYNEMYTPTIEKTIANIKTTEYPNTTTLHLEDLDVYELIHYFEGDARGKYRISITYDKLKGIIKDQNIKTIRGYGYWSRRTTINNINKNLNIPSYEFDTEWISWADLLSEPTFTYEEAKTFIKNNLDLSNVNNVVEWYKYFDEMVDDEYYEYTKISPIFMNQFAKLPTKPNIYYKEFVSYDDYLGKKLDKIVVKKADNKWNYNLIKQNIEI